MSHELASISSVDLKGVGVRVGVGVRRLVGDRIDA